MSRTLPRRVAIVTPAPWHATDPAKFSIDLAVYADAFAAGGIDPIIVCPSGSETAGSRYPVVAAETGRLSETGFWSQLGVDAALTLTWLGQARILEAQRAAGLFAVSKGDTNGRVSSRLWPREYYSRLVGAEPSYGKKLRGCVRLFRAVAINSPGADANVLRSLAAAHVTSVETHEAAEALARFTSHHRRRELMTCVRVWPHAVSEQILRSPIPSRASKERSVVAVGRWDSPQKNAKLLAATIDRIFARGERLQFTLIGHGANAAFGFLREQHGALVRCIDSVPRVEMENHLRRAMLFVLSSRWESFHIAAHEALCLGASVVGPLVPPMPDLTRHASIESGTVARKATAESLADAVQAELGKWEGGRRNPEQLAAFWRSRLSASSVVSDFVACYDAWRQAESGPLAAIEGMTG